MIQLVMTYMSTIGFNINNIHRNRLKMNVTETADRDTDTHHHHCQCDEMLTIS